MPKFIKLQKKNDDNQVKEDILKEDNLNPENIMDWHDFKVISDLLIA